MSQLSDKSLKNVWQCHLFMLTKIYDPYIMPMLPRLGAVQGEDAYTMSSDQITIAGEVFNVPIRYSEGHELTAGEAAALNQTFHENLRNNFAKRVKDAKDAGDLDTESLQEELNRYAEDYQFGVRTGGGAVRDPVMAEALNIARQQVKVAIKRKGIQVSQVSAATITEAAKKLLAHPEKGQPIMELARARVEEAQNVAADDLSELVSDLPLKSEAA